MQRIYIGVDFHARQQTICYLKTETGELVSCELKHQDKEAVRTFYAAFRGQVIVGLEASGYSPWFEQLLEGLGHEVWLGHATEIRRRARWRQKNDRRDAELILDLMLHDEFPRLHRPAVPSREVLRMLRYRQKLIKIRTMSKNSVQALALQVGLAKGAHLFTKDGQQQLEAAEMSPVMQLAVRAHGGNCCSHSTNNCWRSWCGARQQSKSDVCVCGCGRIQGLGYLLPSAWRTACNRSARFRNTRKVVAYAGLDPVERSSAERKCFLGISKAGSRLLRHLLVEAAQDRSAEKTRT